MAVDAYGSLEAIRSEAKLQLEKAGVESIHVEALQTYTLEGGHKLVLAVINKERQVAYATLCDRMHELNFYDFAQQCIAPAVAACVREFARRQESKD